MNAQLVTQRTEAGPRVYRKAFEPGHTRKLLLIADESLEFWPALLYAAARAARTGGCIKMLHVIELEPHDETYWLSVKTTHVKERSLRARAIFKQARNFLRTNDLNGVVAEDCIRSGEINLSIANEIDSDPDIALLVLGAANQSTGPGPIVAHLTSGSKAAEFRIPIVIVPGSLTPDEIRSLA